MTTTPVGDGDDPITSFWLVARGHARLGDAEAVLGQGQLAMMPPPAWAFSEEPDEANRLLALVLAGEKTATSAALSEFEEAGEPLPRAGDLAILLDGDGLPRALIRDTAVRVVPFGEVDATHVEAEGEDGGDVATWRARHAAELSEDADSTEQAWDDVPMVLEEFQVRYHN